MAFTTKACVPQTFSQLKALVSRELGLDDAGIKETSKDLDRAATQSNALGYVGLKVLGCIYEGAAAIISPEKHYKELTLLAKQSDSPVAKRGMQAGAAVFGTATAFYKTPLHVAEGMARLAAEPVETAKAIPAAIASIPSGMIDGATKIWDGDVAGGSADITNAAISVYAVWKTVGALATAGSMVVSGVKAARATSVITKVEGTVGPAPKPAVGARSDAWRATRTTDVIDELPVVNSPFVSPDLTLRIDTAIIGGAPKDARFAIHHDGRLYVSIQNAAPAIEVPVEVVSHAPKRGLNVPQYRPSGAAGQTVNVTPEPRPIQNRK